MTTASYTRLVRDYLKAEKEWCRTHDPASKMVADALFKKIEIETPNQLRRLASFSSITEPTL